MSLTITGANLDDQLVNVRIVGDTIWDVGPHVRPEPEDETIDAEGMAVVPGLVNGHTHAAMTLMRGYGDDLPLMQWLQTRIWPTEARLEPDDVYWGTRLAAIEMLRSGTVHFADMYWHGTAVARAAQQTGIRATVSSVFFDGGDPAAGNEQRPRVSETLDELSDFGDLIRPSVGPHSVYTVSRESLEWLAEISAERDLPLHIHLSETADEVSDCESAHGLRPPALLDKLGALNERSLLAHGNWLDEHELDLVAERKATVVTNPSSNMKLATGRTFPYAKAAQRGLRVGLGTDGAASNNSLDLLSDVKLLALVHKQLEGDPAVLPADEALTVAAGIRSPLLGGSAITPGSTADLLLVRTDTPELTPSPLAASLVYAASASAVHTAVVAGKVVMADRYVSGTEEVLHEVRGRAAKLRLDR